MAHIELPQVSGEADGTPVASALCTLRARAAAHIGLEPVLKRCIPADGNPVARHFLRSFYPAACMPSQL